MIDRQNELKIEIYVMELAEQRGIKTKIELEAFSERLHQIIENALMDYASDENIEDYEPQFWVKVIFKGERYEYY